MTSPSLPRCEGESGMRVWLWACGPGRKPGSLLECGCGLRSVCLFPKKFYIYQATGVCCPHPHSDQHPPFYCTVDAAPTVPTPTAHRAF